MVNALPPGARAVLNVVYGAAVDLAAPGKDILTLRPGGGLAIAEGTSFAAPHVSGLLLAGELSGQGTPCGDRDSIAEPIAHNES